MSTLEGHARAPARAHDRGRALAAVAAALAFATLYLHMSELGGRLAQDLAYDDVSYANEAATHVQHLLDGGFPGLVRSLRDLPPHSPWSTGLAMLAFLFGGFSEFALYASNTVLLVFAALFVARRSEASGGIAAALAIAAVLASPIAFAAIHEFRPDIALGLVTALAAWLWWSGTGGADRRAPLLAGLALGAALWVKPSFFAHTLAIGGALAAGGLVARLLARRHPAWSPLAASPADAVRLLAVALLVAAPYMAVEGRSVFEYFWLNTQGANREVWSFPREASIAQLATLMAPFVFAHAGWQALFAMPFTLAMAATLWRHDRDGALRLAAWMGTGLLSLAVIVAGRHKNGMFFATFHWVALLGAAIGFLQVDRVLTGPRRALLRIAFGAGVVALIIANGMEPRFHPSPDTRHGDSWNERILGLVEEDHREAGRDAAPVVYVALSGPVNASALEWLARKSGRRLEARSDPYLASVPEALRRFDRADYLVLPDPLRADYARYMPDASIVESLLASMVSDPTVRELGKPDADRRYHVFAHKRDRADATGPVVRLAGQALALEGLRAEEGPFPDRPVPLPRLRWMVGDRARACTVVKPGAPLRLDVEFFAVRRGEMRVLGDNGEVLADWALPGERFGAHTLEYIARTARQCLEFRVTTEGTAPTVAPLFFSKIDLRDGS